MGFAQELYFLLSFWAQQRGTEVVITTSEKGRHGSASVLHWRGFRSLSPAVNELHHQLGLRAAVSPPSSTAGVTPHATAPAGTSHGSNHSTAPPLGQGLSTTQQQRSERALPLCKITGGGAVERKCLLQLGMRSAVSTSEWLPVYCCKWGNVGSVQTNPAAGNCDIKLERGGCAWLQTVSQTVHSQQCVKSPTGSQHQLPMSTSWPDDQ